MKTSSKQPDSASGTARVISRILKEHGFQKAGILTEGYDINRVATSVHVDYHIDTDQPDKDRVRKAHQIAQMREVLFELSYISSHPKAIYIECLKP